MSEKKELTTTAETEPDKKGRGRPKGSKNKKTLAASEKKLTPEENAKLIMHEFAFSERAKADKIDRNDAEGISRRTREYFESCAMNNIKPCVAGYANALGVHRSTLRRYLSGDIKVSAEALDEYHKAERVLEALAEDYMQNGNMDRVVGIFLMRNNMYYVNDDAVKDAEVKTAESEISLEKIEAQYQDLPD